MRFTAPGNPGTRTTAGVLPDALRPGGEYTSIVSSASPGVVQAMSRRTVTASMPGRL